MTDDLCRVLLELRMIIARAVIYINADKDHEMGKIYLNTATKKIDEILHEEDKKVSLFA